MREERVMKIGGKEYPFVVTIGALAPIEKELGGSILSLFAGAKDGNDLLRVLTAEKVKTILKYCLQGIKRDDKTVYDLMQQYIEDGNTLDQLVGEVINDFMLTSGFFPTAARGKEEA